MMILSSNVILLQTFFHTNFLSYVKSNIQILLSTILHKDKYSDTHSTSHLDRKIDSVGESLNDPCHITIFTTSDTEPSHIGFLNHLIMYSNERY